MIFNKLVNYIKRVLLNDPYEQRKKKEFDFIDKAIAALESLKEKVDIDPITWGVTTEEQLKEIERIKNITILSECLKKECPQKVKETLLSLKNNNKKGFFGTSIEYVFSNAGSVKGGKDVVFVRLLLLLNKVKSTKIVSYKITTKYVGYEPCEQCRYCYEVVIITRDDKIDYTKQIPDPLPYIRRYHVIESIEKTNDTFVDIVKSFNRYNVMDKYPELFSEEERAAYRNTQEEIDEQCKRIIS